MSYQPFQYLPLNKANREMRLICINQVDLFHYHYSAQPLIATIKHVPLSAKIRYFALSYVWGDPEYSDHIIADGSSLAITRNLNVALYWATAWVITHLPVENDLYLWADGICIDQTNVQEKSWQVEMMRGIYANADSVLAWLGEESKDSTFAVGLIHHLADFTRYIGVKSKSLWKGLPLADWDWKPLRDLLNRAYFERVWIFQEVVFASQLVFICGSSCFTGETASRCARVMQHIGQDPETVEKVQLTAGDLNFLGAFYSSASLSEMMKSRAVFQDGKALSLLTLLTERFGYHRMRATDRRDYIYARIGPCSDAMQLGMRPDYEKAWPQLYRDLAIAMVQRGGISELQYLFSICRHRWKNGLESWVPKWSSVTTTRPGFTHDTYEHRRHLFSAACKTTQTPEFVGNIHNGRVSLKLLGIHQSSVRVTEYPRSKEVLSTEAISRDWLHKPWFRAVSDLLRSDSPHPHPHESATTGMRILCGDIEWKGSGSEPSRLRDSFDIDSDASIPFRREPCLFTTSNAEIGMASEHARIEDEVWIIKGVELPVILRRMAEDEYCFVSEAYVHGIMDGEALEKKPEWKTIRLV